MDKLTNILQKIGSVLLIFSILLSCKKEKSQNAASGGNQPIPSCSENSGSFSIDVNGEHFELVLDEETYYTNVYNFFNEDASDFFLSGKDQNSNFIGVELSLPGKFNLGSTTYTKNGEGFDLFDIDVDTFNLYVSNVTFNVQTSNLTIDGGIGIYSPMRASFTGLAHSYPWINGQAPADTVTISGTICLNGFIIP